MPARSEYRRPISTEPRKSIHTCRTTLGGGDDRRPLRKRDPAIVNQVLQPMRGHVQGRSIHSSFVAGGRLGALSPQDIIDFFFDGIELRAATCFPYPPRERI